MHLHIIIHDPSGGRIYVLLMVTNAAQIRYNQTELMCQQILIVCKRM